MFLHSAHSPFTSFKLPHTISYSSISFLQALPIPALADRPPFCMRQNMELFHPARSCTHLFSTSKTQGLCGVMIGFLLCNLLEFSLSHQQEGTMLSFTHTHTHTLYLLYLVLFLPHARIIVPTNLSIFILFASKSLHLPSSAE